MEGSQNPSGASRREFVSMTVRGISIACLLGLLSPSSTEAREGSRFPAMSRASSAGGVIACISAQASAVGIDILDRGGNAIDAAVATAFAVGVTRPDACGIGGGGFLIYRNAGGASDAIDFRETAPLAVTPDTDFGGNGSFLTFGPVGHGLIGVPGTVAGLAAALEKYGSGRFTLAQVISNEGAAGRPPYAYELARDGMEVSAELSGNMVLYYCRLRFYLPTASIYLAGGQAPYPPGATLVQTDYAKSLKLLMDFGPEAFYQDIVFPDGRESIARLIVRDMQMPQPATHCGPVEEGASLMTAGDLAAYQPIWKNPLVATYRDHEIITMPPPAGGMVALEILNILEGFQLNSNALDPSDPANDSTSWAHSSPNHLHTLAESQKIAWADREAYLADPAFANVPVEILTSQEYADQRRPEIDLYEAGEYLPWQGVNSPSGQESGLHTTHVSVIDCNRNAVAVTLSIQNVFGSGVVAPGAGFLLNDQMSDFSVPGNVNQPEGGKRPRSSQTPAIVVRNDGLPELVTGAGGGRMIILGVVQNIVNVVDFGLDIAHAVDAERIDARVCISGCDRVLFMEDERIYQAVEDELEMRGHTLQRGEPGDDSTHEYGYAPWVQAAGIDPETGLGVAASDVRNLGGSSDPNHPPGSEGGSAGQTTCPPSGIASFEAAPVRGTLAQSRPNPFLDESGSTAIGFEVARAGRATLRIFDASGRHVRLLLDETLPVGAHARSWNGRNDRGEAVGSGVYFYRLDAGEFSDIRALVRLR